MFTAYVKVNSLELERKLQEMERRTGDARPVFARLGEDFVQEFTQNFPAKGTRLGSQWARLSPATILQKARLGFGTDILVRTGKLRDSFKILKTTKRSVEIGTKVGYAGYHQGGTRNMP
jgi:phage gpG-like protein